MMRISFRAHGDVQGLGYRRFAARRPEIWDWRAGCGTTPAAPCAAKPKGPRRH